MNLCVNKNQNNINFKLPEFFTKNNVNIKSTENLIKEVIYLYFNENNKLNTSKINLNNTNQITTNSEALTNISPSNIKKSLLKEKEELIFTGEKIEFLRNIKIMRDAYNERNKNIIHGNKNIKIKTDECDICENKVKLDCHHVIPHEFKGPDINLNYVFICKDVCHKLFTFKTSNPEKALDAINTLKLKNLINIENFKTLINKRLINTKHLKYLLYFNYIHLGGYLELLKNFNKVNKISEINDDKELIKTKLGKSKNRWFRLQATTYFFREFHDIIMQKKNSNFPKNLCDGGCNTDILKSEKECNQIISKEKKYKRHKNKALNGPESPFNYAFLCKNCHRYFTDDKEYQFNIINHFKKIGLVNKENTYQMIEMNQTK